MESSAFPGKIKINLMQLKTYKLLKISNNTKNCTKAVCFFESPMIEPGLKKPTNFGLSKKAHSEKA